MLDNEYSVCVNLMKSSTHNRNKILDVVNELNRYELMSLYMADSFGSMLPSDVTKLIADIRNVSSHPIGFHAHDNMGLAFSNVIAAVDAGAEFIDSTMLGMGRGAGNVSTEQVCMHYGRLETAFQSVAMNKFVHECMVPLKIEYQWGANMHYHAASKYDIHPSYIQEMMLDQRYGPNEIFHVIAQLSNSDATRFDVDNIFDNFKFLRKRSRQDMVDIFMNAITSNENVLMLGPGSHAIENLTSIQRFIKKYKPIVLALNLSVWELNSYITHRIACNPIRLAADLDEFSNYNGSLICPAEQIEQLDIMHLIADADVIDIPIDYTDSCGAVDSHSVSLPKLSSLLYALMISKCYAPKNIFLAGFDGYECNAIKNHEVTGFIMDFEAQNPSVSVSSLFTTEYQIKVNSIYEYI